MRLGPTGAQEGQHADGLPRGSHSKEEVPPAVADQGGTVQRLDNTPGDHLMLEGLEDIVCTGVKRNTMGNDTRITWRDRLGIPQARAGGRRSHDNPSSHGGDRVLKQ